MTISARLALAFSIVLTSIFAVNIFAAEAYRFELDFTSSLPDGNVPVSPNIDFAQLIQNAGIPGVLDPNSISIVNMATGQSIPFARTEDFSYGDSGHLEWPIKEPTHTNYEVRFRTTGSRPALIPQSYTPPVGVGDLLRYNASEPRPIGMIYPSGLVDLTGDGKLDYVGTWNYAHEPGWPKDGVICYPGVGDEGSFNFGDMTRIRYIDYAGSTDYKYLSNTYMTADFADFNGDGLTDLAYCPTYTGAVSFYLNSGARDSGGMPVFVASGSVSTGTNDFDPCRAVDLNNDGAMDFVINNKWLKNTNPSQWPVQLSSPQPLNVGHYSCFYDVDADGRLDAVSLEDMPDEPGLANFRVVWQRNLGTSTPSFGTMTPLADIDVAYPSRLAAVNEGPRRGLLVTHDHYQDTTFFEQTNQPGTGPVFSNFSKAQSVSAAAALSDQSWPSACDWDGDGDQDVLVGGGYGLPRILINEGTSQKMMLSEAQHILSQGEPILITRNQVFGTDNWHDMGYSYPVLTDWDNDGLPDLMMPNETNRIFWYKNIGTRAEPEFGEQLQVICDGYPDSPALRALSASRADDPNYPNNPYPYESEQPFFWRTGVAFADWNGDGLMDMITHDGYTRNATLFSQYEGPMGDLHLRKDYAIELSDGRFVNDSIVGRTSHYTERFDAVDWDGDGLMDIMYSLGSGQNPSIVLLRNVGTETEPVFAPPRTMSLYGAPIYNITSHGPNACSGDFDGDGLPDILACTEWSVYPFYGHNAIEMSQHPSYTISAASQLETGSSRSYSVDWNSDPGANLGGWTDTSNGQLHSAEMQWVANGGVDDSGHLMAYRSATYLPYMVTGRDQVQSETCGNIYAKFGPEINISLDAKLDTGDPPDETGYGWWIYDDNSAVWYKNLDDPGDAPTNWTHYEETISTTWTDTEAAAHGWHSFNSSRSWSELMQNVTQWNFMGRALNYYGGSDYTGHLDNFLMESAYTPLPGDANRDGKVDNTDAMILASNWLREGSNVYWQDGDFNADGTVDDKDATLLASNWGFALNASADVPEPSYGFLLIMLLASANMLRIRFNPLDITSNKGLPR